MNRTGEDIWLSLREGEEGISFVVKAHSIMTVLHEK